MRDRFIEDTNMRGFSDHNILEMLLFYAIPRADTNELAHRLLEHFGSFAAVFEADVDRLKDVEGIGESTAVLIKMIPSIMQRYHEDKNSGIKIKNINDAVNFLRPKFLGQASETLYIVCMNNDSKILKFAPVGSSAINYSLADSRKILKEMIISNASTAIIAHNHPSGICVPSVADVTTTKSISALLAEINARLVDHIIITDDDYFSLASHTKFASCFTSKKKPYDSSVYKY